MQQNANPGWPVSNFAPKFVSDRNVILTDGMTDRARVLLRQKKAFRREESYCSRTAKRANQRIKMETPFNPGQVQEYLTLLTN